MLPSPCTLSGNQSCIGRHHAQCNLSVWAVSGARNDFDGDFYLVLIAECPNAASDTFRAMLRALMTWHGPLVAWVFFSARGLSRIWDVDSQKEALVCE